MKPKVSGIKRVINATRYSCQGLKAAWENEAAFRQEAVLMLIMVLISFFLPVTLVEQLVMIGTVCLVLIIELINSAIEAVVDRIGHEKHELSGRAKDMGSAAVLIALILMTVTWGSILLP